MKKFIELISEVETSGGITELSVIVSVQHIVSVQQKLNGMKGCLIYTCNSSEPINVKEVYEVIAVELGVKEPLPV